MENPGSDRIEALLRSQDKFVRYGAWAFYGFGAFVVLMGVITVLDDPAGFIAILFGLIFIGAGWAMGRLFQTPAGKRRVAASADSFSARRHDGRVSAHTSVVTIDVDEDASEAEVAAARAPKIQRAATAGHRTKAFIYI